MDYRDLKVRAQKLGLTTYASTGNSTMLYGIVGGIHTTSLRKLERAIDKAEKESKT